MAKITRDQISGLQLDDPVKTDLLGLFDEITSREDTIRNLQSKVPKDSQRVVEETDFAAFKKAQGELAEYKQKLAEKLGAEGDKQEDVGFFLPFLSLFTGE